MIPGFGGGLISEYFLEQRIRAGETTLMTSANRLRTRLAAIDAARRALGPASSVRAVFERGAMPLAAALGFTSPSQVVQMPDAMAATLIAGADGVAIFVTSWGERLDRFWRAAIIDAQGRGVRWTLLCNGTHLRLIDAARLYARRFADFDAGALLEHDDAATACAAVFDASNFDGTHAAAPIRALVQASERHAAGVSRSLRDGVLSASTAIVSALAGRAGRARAPAVDDAFEQALIVVYRLLFLLFAEARRLVPLWHPIYRASYSVGALTAAAELPGAAAGLWDTLRAMTRLAHSGCRAGDLQVIAFNGRLFSPAQTPLANRRGVSDAAAQRAVLALATRPAPDGGGRERIAYRDLGVEQLGAVYETLLDYEPHRSSTAGSMPVELRAGSGVRKATGTFYTPQPFAEYLVRRALAPLVRDAAPDDILRLRIVDPAMGSGAFLVGACRYLAAAYEGALVASGRCRPSDLDEPQRAVFRRTVAERCLYGVDINPMAVQLARLSLWLATLAADRPLTFLDHRLLAGNSLAGAWLEQLRRRPAPHARPQRGTRGTPLFGEHSDVLRAIRTAAPARFALESMPADTVDQVRAKERALAAISGRDSSLASWKRVADAWCASWFGDGTHSVEPVAFPALVDAVVSHRSGLPPRAVERQFDAASAIAAAHRFFHWELEFPEVFFDVNGARLAQGGFDAVLGNPPWEMLRDDDARVERRDRSGAALVRFARGCGAYGSSRSGHANLYQLFTERAAALARPGGRIGLVLPSGAATDHGSASLRRMLLSECDVDALVGFENRRGLFPIHRSVRFLLLTATAGRPTRDIVCRLGEHDPSQLELLGEPEGDMGAGAVRISPALLERLSPGDAAIPDLRAPIDLAIAERAGALFRPLGAADGWRARFGRELNATDDRPAFGLPGRGLPIVEGKQLSAFAVDLASSRAAISRRDAARRVDPARFDRARLGYRDVASAANRMTLIAAMLPAGCVTTHTVFCLRTPLPMAAQWFLCGLFNSFVVNFLVRLRVTTHVTTAVIEALPIPMLDQAPRAAREIAACARLLARRHDDGAAARLQALSARLYQLSGDEFRHVLESFPLVPKQTREQAWRAFETQR